MARCMAPYWCVLAWLCLFQARAAAAAAAAAATEPPAAHPLDRPFMVGIYPGKDDSPGAREQRYDDGQHLFDTQLTFQAINELDYGELEAIVEDGRVPILNMEFLVEGSMEPVLAPIVAGDFDEELHAFAEQCAEGGHQLWIRTLHEFNGNWYPWGLLYVEDETGKTNTREELTLAFQHIIDIFRAYNAPVHFQLDVNAHNGKGNESPFSAFWPFGLDGIEAVSITCYNRAFTAYHPYSFPFRNLFMSAYVQVLQLTDLPIWVAETDKPFWIRQTFQDLAVRFPRVVQVTWFLIDKEQDGKVTDWDLHTDEEVQAFVDGRQFAMNITGNL